jgi:hypothetical protein
MPWKKHLRRSTLRRKYSLCPVITEISVHGWLASLLWIWSETEHGSRESEMSQSCVSPGDSEAEGDPNLLPTTTSYLLPSYHLPNLLPTTVLFSPSIQLCSHEGWMLCWSQSLVTELPLKSPLLPAELLAHMLSGHILDLNHNRMLNLYLPMSPFISVSFHFIDFSVLSFIFLDAYILGLLCFSRRLKLL